MYVVSSMSLFLNSQMTRSLKGRAELPAGGGVGAGEAGVAVCEVVQQRAGGHQLPRHLARHLQRHGGRHQGEGDAPAAGHRHARLVIAPDLQLNL
mgnify:CR=1 FL=1